MKKLSKINKIISYISLNNIVFGMELLIRKPHVFFNAVKDVFFSKNKNQVVLYTEITTHCNSNCISCAIAKISRKGTIKEEVKKKVAELISANPDIHFLVYFHLIGEPLLYSGLEDYIKLLSLPNAELWVCTNGTLLTNERIESLREAGLSNIWYSMFYTDKENYESFTRSDNYSTASKNLYDLLSKNKLFKRIKIITFSKHLKDIKSVIRDKKNVTLETDRILKKWSYDQKPILKTICVSIDGKVCFGWKDYDFKTSIGNICDLSPATIIKKYYES